MNFALLGSVRDRIQVGVPLPFNIRNSDKTLLLARGQIIASLDQMEALFERGALVDAEEAAAAARGEIASARADQLPGMWTSCFDRVGSTLRQGVQTGAEFRNALDEASKPVLALIERDPDLAIFQVVRQGANGKAHYGVTHALHAAIATQLVAQRLGWNGEETRRVFKAALTMNLSMMELQGRLAFQVTALTDQQREAIHDHPAQSVKMLESYGITDTLWLRAVEEHHETPDGRGYPVGKSSDICDLAGLIRRADIYTAKLSARVNRPALAANEAARALFMQESGHPMTAALVKEFGVFPPGCYVKLSSGEVGIVIKRGDRADTPIVASLTNRRGEPLIEPLRRNTGVKEHQIVGVVNEASVRVRTSPEKLVTLANA